MQQETLATFLTLLSLRKKILFGQIGSKTIQLWLFPMFFLEVQTVFNLNGTLD